MQQYTRLFKADDEPDIFCDSLKIKDHAWKLYKNNWTSTRSSAQHQHSSCNEVSTTANKEYAGDSPRNDVWCHIRHTRFSLIIIQRGHLYQVISELEQVISPKIKEHREDDITEGQILEYLYNWSILPWAPACQLQLAGNMAPLSTLLLTDPSSF